MAANYRRHHPGATGDYPFLGAMRVDAEVAHGHMGRVASKALANIGLHIRGTNVVIERVELERNEFADFALIDPKERLHPAHRTGGVSWHPYNGNVIRFPNNNREYVLALHSRQNHGEVKHRTHIHVRCGDGPAPVPDDLFVQLRSALGPHFALRGADGGLFPLTDDGSGATIPVGAGPFELLPRGALAQGVCFEPAESGQRLTVETPDGHMFGNRRGNGNPVFVPLADLCSSGAAPVRVHTEPWDRTPVPEPLPEISLDFEPLPGTSPARRVARCD